MKRGLGWAACAAAVVAAAPAAAQTLHEAMAMAYQGNPSLLAQRAQLRAANEGVPQALAGWRPTVTFASEYGWRDQQSNNSGSGSSPDASTTPFVNTFSASQPLYRGGRTESGVASAEATVRAGRADLLSAEQSVLLQVVTAYMDVLRDQSVVDLNRNNEIVLRQQLEATQTRFRVGEITRTDVAQAEARLSRAISDRVSAEGSLATSRANFKQVVGEAPGLLASPPPLPPPPANLAAAQDVAFGDNPDLQAATYREEASRSDIRTTLGALLPSVSLNATFSRSDEATQRDVRTDTGRVVAQLSVPLYEAGNTYSQVRQRRQVNQQRRFEIDQVRREVQESVTRSWETLATARANIVARQAEAAANRIALEGVNQEAQVGARTTLDVLDAEQELLDAEVALVRARRDEYVAGFQLQSAIGRLTARRLELPVEPYDPVAHYSRVRDRWFGLNGDD